MLIGDQTRKARLRQYWEVALVCVLGGPLAASALSAAELAWKPDKVIEIIATNAPGGGSDRIIRMMVKTMQQRRELTVPIAVVNKPGGGAMGMSILMAVLGVGALKLEFDRVVAQ